jgi:prevent-host-death family protein
MCYMESVGVRELRQNLSVYLRRVARGEALRVTERGRAVAVLGPLPPEDDPLTDLIAAGRVTPATARLVDLPPPLQLRPGAPTLSEVLQQLRDEDDR